MFTKYVLPVLAAAGLALAIFAVVQGSQTSPPSVPVVPPTTGPRFAAISGAGIVEAKTENIPIGVNIPGVVKAVHVAKGDHVTAGQPLFSLDDTELTAQLQVKEAELAAALAQLERLDKSPRPEDVPPAQAAMDEAKARLDDSESAMARTKKLYDRQMAPASDYDRDRFAYLAAKSSFLKSRAEFERIKAGAWDRDKDVARAAVKLAEAQSEAIRRQIGLLTVRARTDGDVLQLNVRVGQFAAMSWREPMVLLGDVTRFHVRVDIDENDLPLFDPQAEAVATLKGRPGVRFPLKLRYVEPYVIPKQSLTGANSERVDTRVLQVVYALPDETPVKVYVGQQMDVYVRAAKNPRGLSLDFGDKIDRPFDEAAPKPAETEKAPGKPGRG